LRVSKAHLDLISEQEVHPFAGGWSSFNRTRRPTVHRSGTAPLDVWGKYRREFPSSLQRGFLEEVSPGSCQLVGSGRNILKTWNFYASISSTSASMSSLSW
jgi:hypothetical protein